MIIQGIKQLQLFY